MDLEEIYEGTGTYKEGDTFRSRQGGLWHGVMYLWRVGGVFPDGAYEMNRILPDGTVLETVEFTDQDIERFSLELIIDRKIKSSSSKSILPYNYLRNSAGFLWWKA